MHVLASVGAMCETCCHFLLPVGKSHVSKIPCLSILPPRIGTSRQTFAITLWRISPSRSMACMTDPGSKSFVLLQRQTTDPRTAERL